MRLLIFLLLVVLIPTGAIASKETIYASYKYTMSDNDSKNDARRLAFIEAKKLVIEKMILFIENEPRIKDYSISKNEIKAYIGAIINAQIDKEEFDLSWGSQTLNMTVKAVIDILPVITTLDIIKNDRELSDKLIKEQMELNKMEVKLNEIQKRISVENRSDKAIYLRKNRADILINMSESISKSIPETACEIDRLQNSINILSDKVINNVRNGMTKLEITDILGKPRKTFSYFDNNKSTFCENYGKYWIIIDTNSVIGYIPYNKYQGCNPNIIKQLTAFEDLIK